MDATVSSLYIYPDSDSPAQELDSVQFTETGPEGNRAKKHAVHLIAADDYIETHPKANVVLDIDGDTLAALVGKLVRLGEATIRVTRRPAECLGVYAEVIEPGEVSLDDKLLVAEESPGS